jgi:hypothetical protein
LVLKDFEVRAFLDGTKTQKRFVVQWKDPEPGLNLNFSGLSVGHYCTDVPESGHVLYSRRGDGCWEQRTKPTFPRYEVGQVLWVRERWRIASVNHGMQNRFYTVQFGDHAVLPHPQPDESLFAPLAAKDQFSEGQTAVAFGRWRPSIFMPRCASRLTLRITSLKVERLTDISEADAIAEGFSPSVSRWWQGFERHPDGSRCMVEGGASPDGPPPEWMESPELQTSTRTAREQFALTWKDVYGAGSFNAETWVWAITFDRA